MAQLRRRLFIDKKTSSREREKMIYLAAENECNTLVFSMDDNFFKSKNKNYIKLIRNKALNIEAGGRDLPLLVPKRLFYANRELFRMEQGSRKNDRHFCPTNPETIKLIKENTCKWLECILQYVTPPRIFHLLPEENHQNTWCACPACRAFSPAEQYLIAVNCFADALAKFDNEARISYIDYETEPDAEGISPRKNVFSSLLL